MCVHACFPCRHTLKFVDGLRPHELASAMHALGVLGSLSAPDPPELTPFADLAAVLLVQVRYARDSYYSWHVHLCDGGCLLYGLCVSRRGQGCL